MADLKRWLSLSLTAVLASCAADAGSNEEDSEEPSERPIPGQERAAQRPIAYDVEATDDSGNPTFVTGTLGQLTQPLERATAETTLRPALDGIAPVFGLHATDFRIVDVVTDSAGYQHARYAQVVHDGSEVLGGELVVHINPAGVIYAANGAPRGGLVSARARAALTADGALARVRATPPAWYLDASQLNMTSSRQVFVVSPFDDTLHLAYEIIVDGERADAPLHDLLYVDASTAQPVAVRPQIETVLSRKVYTANNGSSLPGTLKRSEGQAADADAAVNDSYDHGGTTYNCYKTLFGRDSYDDKGGQLTSTIHYSVRYNNAYWNGSQMVYGDGDGNILGPLSRSLDVTAHELTHGVTQHASGLTYLNESGALNEANSDIFGAICEAWKTNNFVPNANTWMVGEDVWTPKTAGDALRYMDNPTKDGQSYDYWPERYTGWSDNGGVHLNSGIGNLAFYLLSQGGKHPRNKTTVTVPALGLAKTAQILYRAATTYYVSSTNFKAARAAWAQAAQDLYGASEVAAVHLAWDAVGVQGTPVPPANDFSIAVTPAAATVAPGNVATITVTTAVTTGTPGTVNLTIAGLPTDATGTFTPPSVVSGGSSKLTITTRTSTPLGTSALRITGTAGAASHSVSVALTVAKDSPPPPAGEIVNGDFEVGDLRGWDGEGRVAASTGRRHNQSAFSARVGSTKAYNGDSSISQAVAVPATGTTTLKLYYFLRCEFDSYAHDQQQGFVLDASGKILKTLFDTCQNNTKWQSATVDLTPWAGTTILLHFNDHDDGYPGYPTWFYVDDITVTNK